MSSPGNKALLSPVKCNLCGCDKYTVVYKAYTGNISTIELAPYTITENQPGLHLRIVKCLKCGLIYANPRPLVTALYANYARTIDPEYLEEEQGRRLSAQSILSGLQKLKKSGRLLDIGCSTGFLLDEARKIGWEAYGVELSGWAADYARDKLALANVFKGVLKEANYTAGYFDAVVMNDTIEHLSDPMAALIEIKRILKFDGIVCVNTPDIASFIGKVLQARWWGVKQMHLYYFTCKSLRSMLETAGFTTIETKSYIRVFSLKYWISKIKVYNKMVWAIGMFLIKNGIVKDKLVKINLRDQVQVYARKNA